MITNKKQVITDFHIFLGIIITLIIIGLAFIYSSSSVYALTLFGSSHYFIKKQFLGLLLGMGGLVIAYLTPLSFIKKASPLLFWASFGLTTLTLFSPFTHRIHGSSRWLNLCGFTFQPSELLKIAFLIYIAYLLSKKAPSTSSLFRNYFPFIVILGTTALLLLKQPDFGLMITLCTTAFILMFIAQFHLKHLFIIIASLIPVFSFLIFIRPYRLKRILTFLNPWADPQGSGFQIIQSLIAIGSGNIWGVGIANSKQKFFYLPMQHTDFIFSIIAEETGFSGCFFLLLLYTLLLYFGIRVACHMHNRFSMFAILGFIILMSLQAIINIAVATNLLPTKGIGLPFVSYGNTSLVCNLGMLGLIMNMVYSEKTT